MTETTPPANASQKYHLPNQFSNTNHRMSTAVNPTSASRRCCRGASCTTQGPAAATNTNRIAVST